MICRLISFSAQLGSNMTIHLEVGDGAGHTFDASQVIMSDLLKALVISVDKSSSNCL